MTLSRDYVPNPINPNSTIKVARNVPPVERLVKAGTLKKRHLLAADRFYRSYMIGVEGAWDYEGGQLPHIHLAGWERAHLSETRLAELTSYGLAVKALGKNADCVIWVVIHEYPVRQAAPKMRTRRRNVVSGLRDGLDALARHYEIG